MSLDIFILGAAKPATGISPVALKKVGNTARVIDWQIDSFKLISYNQINFLGGYNIEDIVRHNPQINYTLIKDWQIQQPDLSLVLLLQSTKSNEKI